MRTFLHVGCGPQNKSSIAKGFNTPDWEEIRLDIDAKAQPDILGTMTDMSNVTAGSMDALYSSHNIEHLFVHEVPLALKEFKRVLKPEGFVVITCPDIQTVCEFVVSDRLLEPLYVSPAGPIAPIDILYGHRGMIAQGNTYMAHKCGFTYAVLAQCFLDAGFARVFGGRRRQEFDLWLVAYKTSIAEESMKKTVLSYLP